MINNGWKTKNNVIHDKGSKKRKKINYWSANFFKINRITVYIDKAIAISIKKYRKFFDILYIIIEFINNNIIINV
ncbi:hypothetical protein B6F84_07870 [Acidianus manzaensis]|uniref:Uncharacterized protein n=1 Tax=Acidianus manzaensis TaxID=282676 RepID=A0A1W6K0E4_9CREN|nr:hypothetical protein B6F84_07870 [Acidianus manzaensis]